MSQCVPNWELDDSVLRPGHPAASASTSTSDVPMLDYEMAELTWENGQLSMHGLGLRRVSSTNKCAWERPRAASGTLESIVAPCFGGGKAIADALVPCEEERRRRPEHTAVDSCSGAKGGEEGSVPKKARSAPRVVPEGSVSGTVGLTDSWHVPTVDTCEKGNTLSSSGRPGSTANDEHDSVCHSRPPQSETGDEQDTKRNAKSSSSTRRSRAAAIHNQSERKRRDKINQKMKTLQKLVPNSNKTDKASMLDEVIDYLKQLQAQVQMMSRMSVSPAAAAMNMNMMMPQLAMQQQLHMSMMAAAAAAASPMGMGMGALGMGMGMTSMPPAMDINPMARQNQMAASFMPLAAAWDVAAPSTPDRQAATAVVPTDPISSYLACQPQPMTVEAYSRMIALIQQQQQQLASLSKH